MNKDTLYISLVLTQHIGNHIKGNIDNKLNNMNRILGIFMVISIELNLVVHYGIQYYVLQQHIAAQYGSLRQKVFDIMLPKLLFALK